MSGKPDMTVAFAGLKLRNPVLAASGTFGYGIEWKPLMDLSQLGGFVTKGLSIQPMPGNPPPRMLVIRSGMLNAIGLQNVGVEEFIEEKLPKLARLDTAVFANVFGEETEDYSEVVRKLEAAGGLAGYELNLSCPNTASGGVIFGSDPELIQQVVASVRKVCQRPLLVKLTPNVPEIGPIALAAAQAGADALSLVNTFTGMQSEAGGGQTGLSHGGGGLSGPVIHARALRLVEQVAQEVAIPVIGIGGIICGADAAAFLGADAVAVQVGTANFYDPLATLRIIHELENHCIQAGIRRVSELAGPPKSGNGTLAGEG